MKTQTKKGNAAVMAVIIIVVIITTAVITWLYITKTQTSSPSSAQQQNNQQLSTEKTSNWQTYSDKSIGFFFKYPQSLKLSIDQSDQQLRNSMVQPYGGYIISFNAPTNDPNWNAQNIYSYPELRIYVIPKNKKSLLTADCKKGNIVSEICQQPPVAESEKYIAWLSNYNQDAPNDAIKKDLLDKIAATFKFTVGTEVVNNKVYNSELGYSFEYPSSWTCTASMNNDVQVGDKCIGTETQREIDAMKKGGQNYYIVSDFEVSVLDTDIKTYMNDPTTEKIGNIIFAGKKSYDVIIGGYAANYGVVTDFNGKVLEIKFQKDSKEKIGENENRIISTFKFVR